MTKQEIQQKVNQFMIERLEFEPSSLTPETELKRDLGISSVDAVAITTFVQKTFGCRINLPEIKALITIQDLYNYIEQYQ